MEDVGASCATALGVRSWDQQGLFLRVCQEVRGLGNAQRAGGGGDGVGGRDTGLL